MRMQSADYPAAAPDGRRRAGRRRPRVAAFSTSRSAIRNARSGSDEAELRPSICPAIGPGIEPHELFPQPHERLLVRAAGGDRIRARIFERGVGETSASGTGASGAAVAHVLRGGDSPVTVVLDGGELEVEVGEDLHVTSHRLGGPGVLAAR